ncbi:hypothetical protein K7432_014139 [Basidiobolus ranarum]|uniref:Aspergillus nuclease S(1) n=1 Tax=Basidiobolus ranarum TaxID=34480 RepID=A0ABR2VQY1_9FUNG
MWIGLLILSTIVPWSRAWGRTGHRMTGAIADAFLSSTAKAQLLSILPRESKGKLENVASWPDQVKYDPNSPYYQWSENLHFVSPFDNPPTHCSFLYSRDCPHDWCIVGAMNNFSNMISCYNPLREQVNQDAVRFVTHFIGDITQPLHVCGRSRGGNDELATWRNETIDFHYVWDSKILEERLQMSFNNSFEAFRDQFVFDIKWGSYKDVKKQWLRCSGNTDEYTKKWFLCPNAWALETSLLNCGSLWTDYDADVTSDLSGKYYRNHIQIVEEQVAKSGYRIAQIFNNMFEICSDKYQSNLLYKQV